ncbi:excalibur calcium-binding domain-containing protein [Arthrobacter zhaoguopingii]|uniref:excalibur calcium-binding domain-containing protein n=1 Tax=Arthrobacter zhaoguopingii TaxID=2681491 RepID=UPI001FEF71B6|nr:excalibur calcium-binding domain-containing protein [Arthrobacter zhaoguopingii]
MFGLVFVVVVFGAIELFGGGSGTSSNTDPAYEEPATNTDIQQVEPVQEYSNWSYSNCDEARAAGAAPVYASEPGYGSHLDRDSDGIGCDV